MNKIHKKKVVEHYDFSKKPNSPTPLILVARLVASLMRIGRKVDIKYENIKKVPRPSLVLANHGAFNDFYILYKSIKTQKMNCIATLDALNDFSNLLMRMLGIIPKRKFANDIYLLKHMRYATKKLKNVVVMYPEARYSLDGTTSYLPDSLGKLVKFLKVPVITINARGNYVSDPQWNKYKQNYMPMEATVKQIVSQEEIETLSVDEINKRIRENLEYDDWKWLKESGAKIKYEKRAENLNAILYQCPNCKTEFKMHGEGITLTCKECKKTWEMGEDGVLKALDGNTEFSHIPDWFKWQIENIREEVRSGKYRLEFDCDVYTLPSSKGFVKHKPGKFIQTFEKTILDVNLYGEDKHIELLGTELESVHVEYRYQNEGDVIDIPIKNDSVWVHPTTAKDVITKVSLATEEIRDFAKSKIKK